MLIVYTKTDCPWCEEVIGFLKEKNVEYEERNVFKESDYLYELRMKTGQELCPTLDLDGDILPDAGKKEVEEFLISRKII